MINERVRKMSVVCVAVLGLGSANSVATGAVLPFTEDFATDNSAWKDAANADLSFVGVGGPDTSSYVTGSFTFETQAEGDTPVILRGQDNFDASGDAFVGDWVAQGITAFSTYVRHNAATPLTFFTRFSSSANHPGAVAISFIPVLPNTWTNIAFDISAVSPQFVSFEGSDFNTVFGGIGNVQVGVSVPASLAGSATSITFDLDLPTITPEPATVGLMSLGLMVCLRRRSSV
jgi:hypothetical protein